MRRVFVASYNVHRCVGLDGRCDPERTAAVIAQLEAQVVALQEVELDPAHPTDPQGTPLQVLACRTGMTPIAGRTFDRKGKPYGNAVLTSLPVKQVRQLDLSIGDHEPRGALDIDLDAYGTRLRVIATHLGLSPGERRDQVKRLLEVASHDDEGVTVLLGDINEWFVAGRPLRWLHARFGHGASARSWPAAMPMFKLDRVWVHPSRDLLRFTAVRNDSTRWASDHLPVVAEIEVSGPRHEASAGTAGRVPTVTNS